MKLIEVPAYVADGFNQPLPNPSNKANGEEQHLERVYRLIDEALKDINWPDWDVDHGRYRSPNDNEPYGFERVGDKFYIYAEERGQKCSLAIFKRSDLAAEYFVWLVSEGKAKIDWSLFLDMEP